MDIGKVSDRFGHFPEYRGVTGTPRGVNGPSWAIVEERRRQPGGAPQGVPVTPRYSGKMPEPLGTIPMFKCNLPIYESLTI